MSKKLFLNIKDFKCFHDADIPLNNLTVLSGANGNGKSTVIQALLFLRRTIEHCARWEENHFIMDKIIGLNVELNGPYCLSLGNSAYVITADSGVDTISMGISDNDNNTFNIKYGINTGDELWLTPITPLINKFTNNPLCYQEFYYLNAERIGPRLSQEIHFYDYYNVGHKGEYTAQIIAGLEYNFKIDEKRINEKSLKGNRFGHHVNAWLDFILPGVSITSYYNGETHTARIEVENAFLKGKPVVPTNTGFGISYVLPIIVSGLIAEPDRFLIVENPEAHLHPSAQSNIGYFLGKIANAGVRVIVETHSDHVINGIQLAVAEKTIPHDAVTINFFVSDIGATSESNSNQPEIKSITITEKSELTDWPKGFFDQSQIDYSNLIKQRKNV
jgi:predicted ATPase